MNCDEVHEKIYQFLDGELDASQYEKIRDHIDHCVGCMAREKVERAFKSLISAKSKGIEVPPDLHNRIVNEIKKKADGPSSFVKQNSGKLRFIAAVVVLLALFAIIPRPDGMETVKNLEGRIVQAVGQMTGGTGTRARNCIECENKKLWMIVEDEETADLINDPSFRGCNIIFNGVLDRKKRTVELTSFTIAKDTR